jgi:hypothetical protein
MEETCQGSLHPQAIEGLNLFNAGLYWKAHEALEKAWLDEVNPIRNLYRGILQVGVVYFHIQRCNYLGAMKVFTRSQRWLEPFPDQCLGIDLAQLRRDLQIVIAQVRILGPVRLDEFDQKLLKPVNFHV